MDINKSEYQITIIERIKSLRVKHGITQAELSRILGISSGQLGNIESPKFSHKYTLRQISEFCEYIGYPVEKIFAGTDTELVSTAIIIKNIVRYEQ